MSSAVNEARNALTKYLAESSVESDAKDSTLKQFVKWLVPPALRPCVLRAATDALLLRERRRATQVARYIPVRLHLGSARSRKEGWVNVDLLGHPVDLALNLERPLPFENESVDAIFHEHVLEHFTLHRGFALTQECHRVLKQGGVLRIGVPDTAAYVRSYLQKGMGFLASVRPGRPTPLLAMQEAFYSYGHRTMYDFDTLALVCKAAGFCTAEQRQFGDSRLRPSPDSEDRRVETLYVEAVK